MALLNTKDALSTVPVPWIGLRPVDTYEQLVDSLLALDAAVEQVFGRIERRVAEERTKLQALESRIDAAAQGVKRVAGNPEATAVFSPARYPAAAEAPLFKRLFYDDAVQDARAL